jgi:hypothetical protein
MRTCCLLRDGIHFALISSLSYNPYTQLPDSFTDFATARIGNKRLKPEFITHCRRELIHAQWQLLLDQEFLDAYRHGIVIECPDDVKRRFYPRIFTYSADYPEK